jgi:hypothetical protein
LTDSGYIERRKIRYVCWSELSHIIKIGLAILLILTLGMAGGLYWTWTVSRSNIENGATAVQRSCLSRGDLRLTTAGAIDQLRLLAIGASADADLDDLSPGQRRFIAATQHPVDDLIGQASGDPSYRTKPPGPIPPSVSERVRRLVSTECQRQADEYRETHIPPAPE